MKLQYHHYIKAEGCFHLSSKALFFDDYLFIHSFIHSFTETVWHLNQRVQHISLGCTPREFYFSLFRS
jgi:hypothetical protein